ncbi:MAG: RNA polymerase sigma factor [Candidatus Aminicenantia bacterium]
MKVLLKEEIKLIQEVVNGDRLAEEKLINKLKEGLTWLARRKIGAEHIEDIVQETLWIFIQNLRQGKYEGQTPLRNYIFGIFKNLAVDYIKEKKKEAERITHGKTTENLADNKTPEMKLIEKEKINLIVNWIRKLSSRYREILILHYLEGYSVREISALTNLPQGTVLYRLHIGRKKLLKKANKISVFKDLL